MEYPKADLMPRFFAALIDGVVAWVPSFIPVIGALLGALYLLTKDAIMYQITKQDEWKNKSIGKKLLNLEIVRQDEGDVDFAVSAKRNLPLTIGSIIAIIPILGWVIGPVVAFIFGVLELIFVISDKKGIRLGDRWAQTQVVKIEAASTVEDGPTQKM